jgi:hypothetical protein
LTLRRMDWTLSIQPKWSSNSNLFFINFWFTSKINNLRFIRWGKYYVNDCVCRDYNRLRYRL